MKQRHPWNSTQGKLRKGQMMRVTQSNWFISLHGMFCLVTQRKLTVNRISHLGDFIHLIVNCT